RDGSDSPRCACEAERRPGSLPVPGGGHRERSDDQESEADPGEHLQPGLLERHLREHFRRRGALGRGHRPPELHAAIGRRRRAAAQSTPTNTPTAPNRRRTAAPPRTEKKKNPRGPPSPAQPPKNTPPPATTVTMPIPMIRSTRRRVPSSSISSGAAGGPTAAAAGWTKTTIMNTEPTQAMPPRMCRIRNTTLHVLIARTGVTPGVSTARL